MRSRRGPADRGRLLLEEEALPGMDMLCMLAACRSLLHCTLRAQARYSAQVAVCCFDKTGTLTSDDMVLRGLASLADRGDELVDDVKTAGKDTLRVLAACQSLIQIDGELVGDPLERAAFEATGKHTLQHASAAVLSELRAGYNAGETHLVPPALLTDAEQHGLLSRHLSCSRKAAVLLTIDSFLSFPEAHA